MLDANFIATTAPHMYQGEVYLLVSKRTIPPFALVLHPLLLLSQHWVNPLSFSKLLKLALKLKVLTENFSSQEANTLSNKCRCVLKCVFFGL